MKKLCQEKCKLDDKLFEVRFTENKRKIHLLVGAKRAVFILRNVRSILHDLTKHSR